MAVPKKRVDAVSRKLEKMRADVRKQCDALEALCEDAEALRDSCLDAYESLDDAIQKLSEYA